MARAMSLDRRARRRGPGLVAIVPALLAAVGCAEELGPDRPPTTRVVGRVHVAGRPVGGGWIELVPVDGTRGDLRSAPLRPDGTFEADRVAVGRVAIHLVDPPIRLPLDPTFQRLTSPIRREIADGPAGPIDIDLAAEAARVRRSRR